MIQHGTYLRITDNSGGKYALCIKLLGYYKPKSIARMGHTIYFALIIRTKKEFQRKDGTELKFLNNDIILLDKNKLPIVPIELRKKGWAKVLSISEGII